MIDNRAYKEMRMHAHQCRMVALDQLSKMADKYRMISFVKEKPAFTMHDKSDKNEIVLDHFVYRVTNILRDSTGTRVAVEKCIRDSGNVIIPTIRKDKNGQETEGAPYHVTIGKHFDKKIESAPVEYMSVHKLPTTAIIDCIDIIMRKKIKVKQDKNK